MCPAPEPLENGVEYDKKMYAVGEEVKFECEEGFNLVGSESAICNPNGDFGTYSVSCNPVECIPPVPPNNGKRFDPNRKFYAGDFVTFECEEGFIPSGTVMALCDADGSFGDINWNCEAVQCLKPELEPNMKPREAVKRFYEVGAEVRFECERGYLMSSDEDVIVCGPDGNFNPPSSTCNPITCPAPETPENGVEVEKSEYSYGEMMVFECEQNYIPGGDLFATCGLDGTFGQLQLVCVEIEPVFCTAPTVPENVMAVNEQEGDYEIGDLIMFECKQGFKLVGDARATCGPDGSFGEFKVTCERMICDPPLPPSNTIPIESRTYPVGSSIDYQCAPGYKSLGHVRVTCGLNGFDKPVFECVEILCASPFPPEHGLAALLPYYKYEETIFFECENGYYPTGAKSATCLESDSFENLELVCAPIKCPAPAPPENGVAQEEEEYGYGDSITFQCQPGYHPLGDLSAICGDDGTFGDLDLYCAKIDISKDVGLVTCSNFKLPNYAKPLSRRTYRSGETIDIECMSGYIKLQKEPVVCEDNGQFSRVFVMCLPGGFGPRATTTTTTRAPTTTTEFQLPIRPTKCMVSNLPSNTKTLKKGSFAVAEVITLECNDNYVLIGLDKAICQSDGKFSNFNYECREVTTTADPTATTTATTTTTTIATTTTTKPAVKCPKPQLPEHAFTRDVRSEYDVGDVLVMECDVGFELVSIAPRTCLPSGSFEDSAALCAPVICVIAGTLPNGEIIPQGQQLWDVNTDVTFRCLDGFKLIGAETARCQVDGSFSAPMPRCRKRDAICGGFTPIANGNVEPYQLVYEVGTQVEFYCEDGFFLDGPRTARCLDDGTFGDANPRCVSQDEVQCGIVYPDNGYAVSDKTRYDIGETVNFECFPGYLMRGVGTAVCQTSGRFTEMPTCVLDQTGSSACTPVAPENGFVVPGVHGVGSIIIYGCNKGFRMNGLNESICLYGGIVIPGEPECIAMESEERDSFSLTCTPDQPDNGYIVPRGQTQFPVLSPFEYACDPGYKLSTALKTRICSLDRTMVLAAPSCIPDR